MTKAIANTASVANTSITANANLPLKNEKRSFVQKII
jgi:hypothetical protein